MKPLTSEYAQHVLQQLRDLPPDAAGAAIQETAQRLKKMNWQPILLTDLPDFMTLTREKLSAYIEQLSADRTDLTEQHLSLLLYHYRLLRRLRHDDPKAWDEINALMEDD